MIFEAILSSSLVIFTGMSFKGLPKLFEYFMTISTTFAQVLLLKSYFLHLQSCKSETKYTV